MVFDLRSSGRATGARCVLRNPGEMETCGGNRRIAVRSSICLRNYQGAPARRRLSGSRRLPQIRPIETQFGARGRRSYGINWSRIIPQSSFRPGFAVTLFTQVYVEIAFTISDRLRFLWIHGYDPEGGLGQF